MLPLASTWNRTCAVLRRPFLTPEGYFLRRSRCAERFDCQRAGEMVAFEPLLDCNAAAFGAGFAAFACAFCDALDGAGAGFLASFFFGCSLAFFFGSGFLVAGFLASAFFGSGFLTSACLTGCSTIRSSDGWGRTDGSGASTYPFGRWLTALCGVSAATRRRSPRNLV